MTITYSTPDKTVNGIPATSYSKAIDVPTGRVAIGIAVLMTDNGDQFTVTYDGNPQTLTLKNDSLENISTLRFEDGVVVDATTGSKTIAVAQGTGLPTIEGVIVRAPDPISGIVQDQCAAHCSPLATYYQGDIYRVHIEMYTGNVHLSINGQPWGKLFDGISADRNDNYHFGAAVCSHPYGVVFARVGHNRAQIKLRFAPAGNMGLISPEMTVGDPASVLTYCHMCTTPTGDLYILTRGDDGTGGGSSKDAILYRVQGVSSGSIVVTSEVLWGPAQWSYPRSCRYVMAGNGHGMIEVAANLRASDAAFREVDYAAKDLIDGTWYGLNSVVTGTGAGTHADPRFSDAQSSGNAGDVSAGAGIVLLRSLGTGNRYYEQLLTDMTGWPTTPVLIAAFFDTASMTDGKSYGTTDLRWMHHVPTVRTTLDTLFDANMAKPNSFRVLCGMWWKDEDPSTGICYVALGDRGTRADTNEWSEPVEQYYDWGTGNTIDVFEISGADTTTPVVTLVSSINVLGGYTAWRCSPIENLPGGFVYEAAVNELHQTHRQVISRILLVEDVPEAQQVAAAVDRLRYRFI